MLELYLGEAEAEVAVMRQELARMHLIIERLRNHVIAAERRAANAELELENMKKRCQCQNRDGSA